MDNDLVLDGQVLPFSTLHRIASMTAQRAGPALQDDVYQAAWVRFIRYIPRTRTGAWAMASSSALDCHRRESYQLRIMNAAPPEGSYSIDYDDLDGATRGQAQHELMAIVTAAVDPATLRRLSTHAKFRRLPPDQLEEHRRQALTQIKASTNGELPGLLERAFR